MSSRIPVSVIVVTKNEAPRIERCLGALIDFDEIIVVDSGSTDKTQDLARDNGAQVVNFIWDGAYPKKRQWCLETLDLQHDWVFFVDADEVVTPAVIAEIRALNLNIEAGRAGYFVRGRYVFDDRVLRFGLNNNKLVLFDRRRVAFPVVDDLDLPGMGEIEGHYQPVLKDGCDRALLQLAAPLLHYAYEEVEHWDARHLRYAAWETAMNARGAWPGGVRMSKRIFKALPFQALVAFLHSYVLKLGVLDGAAGFRFARSRRRYYRMIG